MESMIFADSALICFCFERYVSQKYDESEDPTIAHAKHYLFHLILILIMMYNANRMLNEVNNWVK